MSALPRAVWLFGFASFLTDASSEMIVSLLPTFLVGTLAAPPVMLGLLEGIADAVSAILKRVAGGWSDRAPRRKPFVVGGYAISTLARPLVAFASSPWHAVFTRALDRVGKGIRSAPRDALLAESVDAADAPRAFGVHRALDHAGAVVGPLLASLLLALGLHERDIFVAAWIPGSLAVLLLLAVREPPRVVATPQTPTTSAAHRSARARGVWRLVVPCGMAAMGFAAEGYFLLRASSVGFAAAALPMLWLVMHVGKMAAAAWGPKPAHDGAQRRMIALAWCIVAGAIALAAWVPDRTVLACAFVLAGLGHGVREPLERAQVGRLVVDPAQRGATFGAYYVVTGLATLPGGLLIGALWQATSQAWGLSAAAVLCVLGALTLPRASTTPAA